MIPPRDMDRIISFGSKQAKKRVQRRARHGDQGQDRLPPEASITLAAEREATGIDSILAALEEDLIGLAPIKQKVDEIASLLLVDRARRQFGLDAPRPNLHMCFTGSPGTGKTTVALRMASLLRQMGYLETGQLVHAMRNDLVGEYIGQTAPRTKRVLEKAKGGVLFIDEAYYLHNNNDARDFGQEAIGILLQVMENDRDQLVVIMAGYKDRMDEFFNSNPGMSSRIAHHLDFVDYELKELLSIGQVMLGQSHYYLSPDAEAVLGRELSRQMEDPRFSNARSVRNDLDRARLRHAFRLAAEPDRLWDRDDLMRLEPSDLMDDEPG
jgi:probable Rubsico expression protein CbbX